MVRSYGFIESASILLNGKRPSFVTSVFSHDLTVGSRDFPADADRYVRTATDHGYRSIRSTADSITSLPVDDIAQRRAIKIGAQITAE
jgi:hypothetical protein